MTPRPAEPADVPEVLAMIRELADYERALSEVRATEADLAASLFCERPAVFGHVVPAEPGGPHRLAGFALWFLTYSTWLGRHGLYLEDLYVRPPYRGRGHGLSLMRALAAVCEERGYGRFEWAVLDWNEPALEFYRRLGAEPMRGWTVHRMTGDPLAALGRGREGAGK
jgi:GNAT superfamily N-acetyltransferase